MASQKQGVISLVREFRHHGACDYVSLEHLQVGFASSGGFEEVVVVHLLVILEETQEEILGEGLRDSGEVNKIRRRRNRCR